MLTEFAFVQTTPGRMFVGWGPFQHLPLRNPGLPAFFITDFFLSDPRPWKQPSSWEELSVEEFSSRFETRQVPDIDWSAPTLNDFEPLFTSALDEIRRGAFSKIVPVLFETGQLRSHSDLWGYLAGRLPSIPTGLRVYGYAFRHQGLIGATPEVLFETAGSEISTMALAGTRPSDRSAELLTDAKELREHRMVVDDLVSRLSPFGNVEVDDTEILELPTIAHLVTPIRFEPHRLERISFSDMIRRLHPTAALGTWPRTEAGERWLRQADAAVKRRTFGAPFGVELPDDRAIALVAIRNIHWISELIRVGSGAGLLAESRLEREFEELREKREQVKSLFGIASHPSLRQFAEAGRNPDLSC